VQLDLGLGGDKPMPGRCLSRRLRSITPTTVNNSLEVQCSNRAAKFIAYCGYDEVNIETVKVKSRGLCHGEERGRSIFK